jgi:hypothetical protein
MDIEPALEQLRRDIHGSNSPDCSPNYIQRFHFVDLGSDLHIEFHGEALGEACFRFLAGVSSEPIASATASIRMGGPDEGANGTRNWDLTALADAVAGFPNLRHLHIEQNHPLDHNRTIVGATYHEAGVVAKLVRKAPNMSELTVPSAPNIDFFNVSLPSLVYLNVDAGYDTQDFILNMAQSSSFPNLMRLEWGEYCETYMDDWRGRCTPFTHYQNLFRSDAFRQLKSFVFKNPVCSPSELAS